MDGVSGALAHVRELSLFGQVALIMTIILAGITITLWTLVVVERWRRGQRLEGMEWLAIGLLFMMIPTQLTLRQLGFLTESALVVVLGALALAAIVGLAVEWRRWSHVATHQQRKIANLQTATLVLLGITNALCFATSSFMHFI